MKLLPSCTFGAVFPDSQGESACRCWAYRPQSSSLFLAQLAAHMDSYLEAVNRGHREWGFFFCTVKETKLVKLFIITWTHLHGQVESLIMAAEVQ